MKKYKSDFNIKSSLLSLTSVLCFLLFTTLTTSAYSKSSVKGKKTTDAGVLSGFIVSDAHIGFENVNQPTLEKQKMMIRTIRKRFPNLDVFIDTGDAHHNGEDRDKERGDWSDIIMYQDEPVTFYYIPGNHEITHPKTFDTEFVSGQLGSHELRPYYSFDIKGIHFISVPQLIRVVYVSKELIDWLKLDLELNKNKTTIILSHNNLIGYSKVNEPGYRGVVNTQEIIDLISAYPKCVAWMYGHNHNYEVVRKISKLFVSNGRIGGFDPCKGKHGLGGIYFEISKEKVDIRGYSAEFDKFVDELDSSEPYRGKLDIETSYDGTAKPSYTVGIGRAKSGEIVPLFHHHVAMANSMELYIAGVEGSIINEDPEFRYYMNRMPANDRQLMGSSISGGKAAYDWKDPGLLLLATGKKSTITLPRSAHNKFNYYRVAAGKDYKISVNLQGMDCGGQTFNIQTSLYDRSGTLIKTITSDKYVLTGEEQTITEVVGFSAQQNAASIYSDKNSNNLYNLSVELNFDPITKPIMVHKVAIEFNNAEVSTKNPSVKINNQLFEVKKSLPPQQFEQFSVSPRTGNRSVVKVDAGGNGLVTWLLKINDLQFQILGAQVENLQNSMLIGPMTNTYSHRKEVVINPYDGYENKTFLYRMRNVNKAEVFPLEKGNSKIKIKVLETLTGNPELEVYSKRYDLNIKGAVSWAQNGNKFIIAVKAGSEVTIE